jgi:hypothetical protein
MDIIESVLDELGPGPSIDEVADALEASGATGQLKRRLDKLAEVVRGSANLCLSIEYRQPDSELLVEHLGHRQPDEVRAVADRMGWMTGQQMHEKLLGWNGACPWFENAVGD